MVRRIYDLDLPLPSSSSSSSVRMVVSSRDDFFYDWFEGRLDLDSDLHFIDESLDQSPKSDDGEWMQVRVAQSGELPASSGQETFLILDSGSDVSLLIRDYLPDVSAGSGHKLRDCQGNSLGVAGTKKAEILVKDSADDEIVFRQNFLVSNVTNAILSLGALLQKGWNLRCWFLQMALFPSQPTIVVHLLQLTAKFDVCKKSSKKDNRQILSRWMRP